jgi:fibrillarin-like rRNA methylase
VVIPHCQIFKNVADKGQQELLLKNFMRFFPKQGNTSILDV